MPRNHAFEGQRRQEVEATPPFREVGMRRGGRTVEKHQVAGEQHAGGLVEHHQIGRTVATQCHHANPVMPQQRGAGFSHAIGHHRLGALHAATDHAIEVVVERLAQLADRLAGGG